MGGNCPHHPGGPYLLGLCFICAMRKNRAMSTIWKGGNIQFAPSFPRRKGLKKPGNSPSCLPMPASKRAPLTPQSKSSGTNSSGTSRLTGFCLALGGISIAELYQNPENVVRARRIMEEVVQAARARGYALPEDLVEFPPFPYGNHGAFIPSSAVDYNEGRPVEYTAIWGDLSRPGTKKLPCHGLKMPCFGISLYIEGRLLYGQV